MKIALSKIVGRPILGASGISYEFVEALKKLASDPLSIKDRYALGRTLEDISRWVRAFDGIRTDLVNKHCVTRGVFLENRAQEIRKQIADAQKGEIKHPGLKKLRESLTRIESERLSEGQEQLVPETSDKAKELTAALETEMRVEVDLFLDHKIKLTEESKLSGSEIATLIDLIEEPS